MKIKRVVIIIVGFLVLLLGVTAVYYYLGRKEIPKYPDILVLQHQQEEKYLKKLSEKSYSFNDPLIIVDPYDISPLTALVMFKTKEAESIEVIIKGKDEQTTITHQFKEAKEHILPIYGLYPDYENKVILKKGEEEQEIKIRTSSLPEDFILPTNVKVDKNKVDTKLIFVTTAGRGYNAAYDINGDVRWYLVGNYAWDISRLENGNILLGSNRLIAPPYYTIGLVEIDLTGKIYKEYVLPGGYHHDVFEMKDNNLLVASNNFPDQTTEDYIVLVDRKTGKILKNWDLKDVLPMTDGKSDMWVPYDWFHNNSVQYDELNKAIVLSGRHQDAVISIDYDTGELNWIIGDNTNWGQKMQKYFFTPISEEFEWQWAQHSAKVLPNGDIFVLDNGNNRSKIKDEYILAKDNYTRGVIYHVDPEKMEIEQLWQYGKERGSDFYSPYISNVVYYEDNHYLVHSGGIGKLNGEATNVPAAMVPEAETTSITVELLNDEVIFELELPGHFYRAAKLNLYEEKDTFKFGKGERLGTLGETTQSEDKVDGMLLSSSKIPEEYKVDFTQEVDRLIFSAELKQGTKVQLILDNFLDRKVYSFTASTQVYTAMCIDIFNEDNLSSDSEKIKVTSYINKEGLKGRYNVYLKIDDEMYNTNQYIDF
ncbi:MAG: aryl-sulfate sulfotransferase [Bacilli bacterium]